MSKSVFQSGMSWKVVEAKWAGTREVMAGFDPDVLATWGDAEVDRAATDTRLIRNRRKIQAVVDNARSMLEVADTHTAFRKYLRSHEDFDATVKALRKRFKFLGESRRVPLPLRRGGAGAAVRGVVRLARREADGDGLSPRPSYRACRFTVAVQLRQAPPATGVGRAVSVVSARC